MDPQPDFNELLGLFNAHEVEYLIVGACALAFHGAPRNTGDIDLLVRMDPANAKKIIAALHEFGVASLGRNPDDFLQPEEV